VKFPTEFDALDLTTDQLKNKLLPVSRKLKEVEKERAERRKVRKRTKAVATSTVTKNTPAPPAAEAAAATASTDGDVTMTDVSAAAEGQDKGKGVVAGELEDESVYREREVKELAELVDAGVRKDIGASQTGLYDLVGA
jgi:ubiquitin carboxyl-terminal hydrolase 14